MSKKHSEPAPKLQDYVTAEPFSCQVQGFRRARRNNRYALFMEQGTGKTLVAIGLSLYRHKRGQVRKVLIITPDSVMGEWVRQYQEHVSSRAVRVTELKGKIVERRKWLNTHRYHGKGPLEVVIANYVTLRELTPELIKWKPDMVVLDESQKIKNRRAKQSKAAHKLGKTVKYRYLLTGTPVSESPLDLWSQYKFLDPKIFPSSYAEFQDRYAVMGGFQRKEVKGYRRLEEFAEKAHSIAYRVTKEEALDLPETLDQTLRFELSAQEHRHYRDMHKDFILKFSDNYAVSAPMVLTQLMKLQQIASGFVIDENGETVSWPSSKLKVLRETLEVIPKHRKVVIFAKFLYEIRMVADLCKKLGISVLTLSGETQDRQSVINRFQREEDPRVLVIQTATGGLGITLTKASYAIFYSMSHSYVDYDQARARVYRIGQENKVTYLHLVGKDTVEEDILQAVQTKGSMADLVTNILRRELEANGKV